MTTVRQDGLERTIFYSNVSDALAFAELKDSAACGTYIMMGGVFGVWSDACYVEESFVWTCLGDGGGQEMAPVALLIQTHDSALTGCCGVIAVASGNVESVGEWKEVEAVVVEGAIGVYLAGGELECAVVSELVGLESFYAIAGPIGVTLFVEVVPGEGAGVFLSFRGAGIYIGVGGIPDDKAVVRYVHERGN